MLPQLDLQTLSSRFARARIAARRRCASRWLDPAHVRTARERAGFLEPAERDHLAPLLDAAESTGVVDGTASTDAEARLEAAAWQSVQAIVGGLQAAGGWGGEDADRSAEKSLARAVALYDIVLPGGEWPTLVVAATRPELRPQLARKLTELGLLAPAQVGQFAELGLAEVALPPEPEVIDALANLRGVAALADPESPVARLEMRTSEADEATDLHTRLNVPDWASRELGAEVTIALLDSGVDRSHADLRDLPADHCRDFTDDDPDGGSGDPLGHGTVLAGQIAGSGASSEQQAWRGLAPRATLLIGKVAGRNGIVRLGPLLHALEWATTDAPADILVLPCGPDGDGTAQAVLRLASEALTRRGRLIVVGAGDAGPDAASVVAPGDVRDVVSVGALDAAGNVPPFSGRGEDAPDSPLAGKPDCVVPGTDIVGPRPASLGRLRRFDDGGHYTLVSGTAASAAILAGLSALVLSAARETHGTSTLPIQIRQSLFGSCRAVESASPETEAGNGLPDVTAAITAVQSALLPEFELSAPATDADDAGADEPDIDVDVDMDDDTHNPAGNGDRPESAGLALAARRGFAPGDDPAAETQRIHPAGETQRVDESTPGVGAGLLDAWETREADAGLEALTDMARDKARERIRLLDPDPTPDTDADGPASGMRGRSGKLATADATPDVAVADEGIHEDELGHPDGLDPETARKLEHEFLNGFEARLYTVSAVANPMENGRKYDVHGTGETTTFFSDRDRLKKLIIETGAGADLRRYPQNKGIEIGLVRKRLFGARQKKMAFVGACITPLDELVKTGRAAGKGTRRALVRMVERVVSDPGCYYYIGVFSTTGWTDDAKDANVRGNNYQLFLLECDEEFGFRAWASPGLDPVVRMAFDPEDELTKLNRARRRLRQAPDMKAPGGFLLIDELAERSNVPDAIALQAADEYAREMEDIRIERVDGTMIVRRKRF